MHGKTFAMVSVAAVVLALVFSLALPIEAATSAHKPEKPEIVGKTPGGGVPELQLEENAGEPDTHLGMFSCLLCVTCGGYWPFFKFSISQPASVATYELNVGCGGINPIPDFLFDPLPSFCCDF